MFNNTHVNVAESTRGKKRKHEPDESEPNN